MSDPDLRRLCESLAEARRVHRLTLRGRQAHSSEAATRAGVLSALDEFIDALEQRGLPVPQALRQEARLLRNLVLSTDAGRRRAGRPSR